MQATIQQEVNGIPDPLTAAAMTAVLRPIGDRLSSQTINSAALRIKGGSASPIVQTNAASAYVVNGHLVTKATALDLPALVGTVTEDNFNVFAFFIDQAGTITSAMGIQASTLFGVVFPNIPENKACIGFVIINPTGTGNFVGGTTVLDNATVVPNAVFCNTLGAFDPSVVTG